MYGANVIGGMLRCWGFPYLKIKKRLGFSVSGFLILGFLVSNFLGTTKLPFHVV